ncbi:TetR/AcrR family transcriptional regulator [Streptacidiphilus sp. PAMC 29251]
MPRITEARREAKRAEIVAAARRCFSRDGFHQTSMPDIAQEAGVSVGASYRYFAGKEDIILEIAGDAFRLIFAPVERLVDGTADPTVADLVAASIAPIASEVAIDAAGQPVPVDELLRCAVQAWGELLRNEGLRQRAAEGFGQVRRRMADVFRHGQAVGTVPADLDPERGTRVVMALLHGFVLQRVAFGLDDTDGFTRDVRAVLTDAGILHPSLCTTSQTTPSR